MGKEVQFSTAQRRWDHTEAAGRWRDRSSLPRQTPQGTVCLGKGRKERERETKEIIVPFIHDENNEQISSPRQCDSQLFNQGFKKYIYFEQYSILLVNFLI